MLTAPVIPQKLTWVPSPSQALLGYGEILGAGPIPTIRPRAHGQQQIILPVETATRVSPRRHCQRCETGEVLLHIPTYRLSSYLLPFFAGEIRNSVRQAVGGRSDDRATVGQNAFWYKAAWQHTAALYDMNIKASLLSRDEVGGGVFVFGRFGQTCFFERCGQALFQFDLRQAIGEVPFPGFRVCSKL